MLSRSAFFNRRMVLFGVLYLGAVVDAWAKTMSWSLTPRTGLIFSTRDGLLVMLRVLLPLVENFTYVTMVSRRSWLVLLVLLLPTMALVAQFMSGRLSSPVLIKGYILEVWRWLWLVLPCIGNHYLVVCRGIL